MTNQNLPSLKIDTERLLTIQQAAKALGIRYKTLLQAVDEGKIPFYKIGNSWRMILVSEVLAATRSTSKTKETKHDYDQ